MATRRTFSSTLLPRVLLAGAALGLAGAAGWYFGPSREVTPVPAAAPDANEPPAALGFSEAIFETAILTQHLEADLRDYEQPGVLLELLRELPMESETLRLQARALLADPRHAHLEPMPSARYILPPEEDAELVAPELDPSERKRAFAMPTVVVLQLRGPGGPPHLVARLGFGLASVLAERLRGFVYDEVRHRIESVKSARSRSAPTGPITGFSPLRISIEFEPGANEQESGRLLSLGMQRFGAPDLQLAWSDADTIAPAAAWLTALCARAAETRIDPRLEIGASELSGDPRHGDQKMVLEFSPAALAEGNPDNTLLEVKPDAPLPLFTRPSVDDAEAAAERRTLAAQRLDGVLARWRRDGGTLFLLADFTGDDGLVEAMWVEITRVDTKGYTGALKNHPEHVKGLRLGGAVTVRREAVSGYRLDGPGGESEHLP